jgi:hypothetical protein
MTRTGIVVAMLLAALLPASASARARLTCRSGSTVFHRGALRAFSVKRYFVDGPDRFPYQSLYGCLTRSGRPRLLYGGSIGEDTGFDMAQLSNGHLGFHISIVGGTSSEDYLGILDLAAGDVRETQIDDPTDPDLGGLAYAIAPDGSIALLWGRHQVDFIRNGRRSLGNERTVASNSNDGFKRGFVAVTATTISWRTTAGALVTVRRPDVPAPPAPATPPAPGP